ncbi:MAG: hypothetical protein KME45_18355 [Stenomitos rutilans HA7619-LM2]|jgi:hypothetical protein|nr:hypothetical protein [Stenomitos rutilans HA7619-LM2]
MLHATVKRHRASYRSLAEGVIPPVLPAIGLRLAAYPSRYAPWFGGECVSFCDRGAATTASS